MDDDKIKFRKALLTSSIILLIIWIVKLIEFSFDLNFVQYGLLPKSFSFLPGVFLFHFIHSGFEHLISNSFPILFLVTAIVYFYPTSAFRVMALIFLFSGIMVWFIGRPSYHIGASAFVYGLITFTFFSGIIKWDRRSIVLSLIVTFLYGGFTWGVLPLDNKVSWEGHLSGAVLGFICAVAFRKLDPYNKFERLEDEEDETNELEN